MQDIEGDTTQYDLEPGEGPPRTNSIGALVTRDVTRITLRRQKWVSLRRIFSLVFLWHTGCCETFSFRNFRGLKYVLAQSIAA